MTGERADRPTVADEPLGPTEPTWRDEQPITAAPRRPDDDDDAERTIDADPAWLAQLPGGADPDGDATGDAERTVDVDSDLLEHVRAAARAARDGLAAPPMPAATGGEVGPAAPAPPAAEGVEPSWPPPRAGVTNSLLPPAEPATLAPPSVERPATVAAVPPAEPAPVAVTGTAATAGAAAAAAGGRWEPPARLRPAETRPAAPLLAERAPKRRHLDWRWAALSIVLAAAVGFLIAIAVGGSDDTPEPTPGSTTVPGASTTVSTP